MRTPAIRILMRPLSSVVIPNIISVFFGFIRQKKQSQFRVSK